MPFVSISYTQRNRMTFYRRRQHTARTQHSLLNLKLLSQTKLTCLVQSDFMANVLGWVSPSSERRRTDELGIIDTWKHGCFRFKTHLTISFRHN